MAEESTNDNTQKPIMVNVGVKVTPELKQQLEEMASNDRRKLGEFVRIKLEDFVREQTAAA